MTQSWQVDKKVTVIQKYDSNISDVVHIVEFVIALFVTFFSCQAQTYCVIIFLVPAALYKGHVKE